MSYFKTCPECGAHLDPGEECDCKEEHRRLSGLRRRTAINYREFEQEDRDYEIIRTDRAVS